MTWQDIILPIALAVIAASPGLVALFRGRKKEQADIAKTITEMASELAKDLKDELRRVKEEYEEELKQIGVELKEQAELIRCQERKIEAQDDRIARQNIKLENQAGRIRDLELERDEILTGVMMLCTQIHDLGQDPVWEPDLPEE